LADLYAKYFECCHLPIASRTRVWKAIAGYLERRYIPRGSNVLELGAGYCDFINQVHAAERCALDQSDVVQDHAAPGVRALVQDCTDLTNLPSEHFDVVFASNLLEHLTLSAAGTMLDQVRRILKPGGRIILIQPNFAYAFRKYFDDITHVQIFTHVSLADFLKLHDFSIAEVNGKFLPFSMRGTRLPTLSWLVTLYLNSPIKPFAGQMLVVGQR
jgi:SAM-dependent methyltransferase